MGLEFSTADLYFDVLVQEYNKCVTDGCKDELTF